MPNRQKATEGEVYHLDWVYAAVSLAGQYTTGKKYWWGWLVQAVGQVLVGFISWRKDLYGMVVLAFLLVALYVWNLYKWWKGIE